MQVPDNKDVANHVVPESCAAHREMRRVALTGVRTGQPLSHDRCIFWVPTLFHRRKATRTSAFHASARLARRGRRTWHVCTLLVREPGDLGFDQPPYWAGPHREGEEP